MLFRVLIGDNEKTMCACIILYSLKVSSVHIFSRKYWQSIFIYSKVRLWISEAPSSSQLSYSQELGSRLLRLWNIVIDREVWLPIFETSPCTSPILTPGRLFRSITKNPRLLKSDASVSSSQACLYPRMIDGWRKRQGRKTGVSPGGMAHPQGPLTNLPTGKKAAWYASLVPSIGHARLGWSSWNACAWRVSRVSALLVASRRREIFLVSQPWGCVPSYASLRRREVSFKTLSDR